MCEHIDIAMTDSDVGFLSCVALYIGADVGDDDDGDANDNHKGGDLRRV